MEDHNMPSDDITTDGVLEDIDRQIELLEAIADRNPVFAEQLRVFREAAAVIRDQALQLQHLDGLIDWDTLPEDAFRSGSPWDRT